MSEEWRAIPGFEGLYEVSDLGRVRSFYKSPIGTLLSLSQSPKGYFYVNLYRDKTPHTKRTYTLVLEAFVGPRPDGEEACHEDGDPSNTARANLRWDTHANNMIDRTKHGRDVQGVRNGVAKLSEEDVAAIRARDGCSQREIAEEYGVNQSTISLIVTRKHWRHV